MKKLKPYIIILITALFLELIVFNFSSLSSALNKESDYTQNMNLEGTETGYVAHLYDINQKVNNIYIDVELEPNTSVNYDITMTDAGNYYDYPLPKGTITANVKASDYINIHSYGEVKTMTIDISYGDNVYKAPFAIKSIKLNVKRPVMFNIVRFLLSIFILSFLYTFRSNSPLLSEKIEHGALNNVKRRQLIIILCVVLCFVGIGYYLTSSHLLFDEGTKPHHQQYKELAHLIKDGKVALDEAPSEGILNAENPYDTIYLQANGIEYKADYAYFNGKYYVYFGIVPEVLCYLPYYLITHKDLPNHVATFMFYCVFVIGVFGLLYKLSNRYFKDLSYYVYLIVSSAIVTAGTFAYIYFTADLYSVPIMAGIGLTLLGLYLWCLGCDLDNAKKVICYIAGSLSMALVAGCRPQMILFSLLAVIIFWDEVIVNRNLFSKKGIGPTIAIVTPYVVIAIGIMYYNYIRFGSVFDFGATYSLTNNDMNLRGISLSRMLLGLGSFLFQLPYINGAFPFLQSVELKYSYMGRMTIEHYFGGIIATNILCLSLFLILYFKEELKKRQLMTFVSVSVCISIVIGMLDANTAGVLQRYSADMALGLFIGTAIMIFIMSIKAPKLGIGFIKIGFLMNLGYTLLLICNTASGITLKYYNPELFGKLEQLFRF